MTARWGVAGRAPVADKVLRDLAHVPNAVLTAVGSRSAERAEAFAGPAVGCAGGRIDERLGVSGFFLGSAELHVDGVSASITKLSYLVIANQFPQSSGISAAGSSPSSPIPPSFRSVTAVA